MSCKCLFQRLYYYICSSIKYQTFLILQSWVKQIILLAEDRRRRVCFYWHITISTIMEISEVWWPCDENILATISYKLKLISLELYISIVYWAYIVKPPTGRGDQRELLRSNRSRIGSNWKSFIYHFNDFLLIHLNHIIKFLEDLVEIIL